MLRKLECLVDSRCGVGESPVFDAGSNRLIWSDNTTDEIHAIELTTRTRRVWHFGGLVGSLGLARTGRWIVAVDNRVVLFDPRTGRRDVLATVPFPKGVWKFNDGKVGPDGAFWVGSMALPEPQRLPVGSLYRVTADGKVEEKIEGGIKVSNGLAWSPDGRRMYHSDSQGGWADVWDFDPATGAMSNRRRFIEHTREQGLPDGAATDMDGFYWSGGFTAQRLNRFAPDGTLAGAFDVPCAVTMPCFGGPDMKTLFFTSLTRHLPDEVNRRLPLNGGVFMAEVDVAGVPVARFAD